MKSLIPVLMLAGLLSACSDEPEIDYTPVAAYTPKQVESYEVQRLFIGRVSASLQTNVSFETQGKVEQLLVDQGDAVKKGQPLAKLDMSLLETQRNELKAQLKDTNVQLKLAETNLRRQQNLIAQGFVAQQQLDEFTSRVNSLNAVRTRLQASLTASEIRLDKAVLKAPFSGTVSMRYIDAGMVIDPSKPVFQIIDKGGIELKVGVPAKLVRSLQAGEDYPVEISGVKSMATYVSASAHIDPSTQTVPVRFALNNTDAHDGQMGVVEIVETYNSQGYWIPVDSVTEGMRGSWVVYGLHKAEGKAGVVKTVKRNAVEILYVNSDEIYVKADLSNDIMAGGLHKVVPGQMVEVVANVTPVPELDQQPEEGDGLRDQLLPLATEAASAPEPVSPQVLQTVVTP